MGDVLPEHLIVKMRSALQSAGALGGDGLFSMCRANVRSGLTFPRDDRKRLWATLMVTGLGSYRGLEKLLHQISYPLPPLLTDRTCSPMRSWNSLWRSYTMPVRYESRANLRFGEHPQDLRKKHVDGRRAQLLPHVIPQ